LSEFKNDLTDKQVIYLADLASGLTTLEVAKKQYVSHHTVRNTITKAKERVGAETTNNLVALSIFKKWIVPETLEPPYRFKVNYD
jgi:DNA-binding CsgD family transcriptional regulator